MKRDFYDDLLKWKEEFISTPLMVVGARQVGKTYLIDKFCKENFSDYLYINLLDNKEIVNLFAENINTEKKIKEMQVILNHEITKETIIFFDEVQVSEDIISAMKYFAEADFPYKIIIAGSLLGVKLKRFTKSFPVGKVIIQHMYPMSFKEFLIAVGNELYVEKIQECYDNNTAISEALHSKLLDYYRDYLCIGGMPMAVKQYIDNNGLILESIKFLGDIIDSYIADMKMYTSNISETNRIEKIYKSIPNQLAKENKKYQFSKIDKNARFRDYETAFLWLLSSELIIPCYYVNRFETPLKGFMDDDNFKIYLNDAGLLTKLLDIDYKMIIGNANNMFKGAIAENYVATELIKNDINLFYYQKPQVMEVDFLIDTSNGVIPIEVKASDNVRSTSLNKFMKENNIKFGIRISTKNFGLENNIKSVPLYAVFCINR